MKTFELNPFYKFEKKIKISVADAFEFKVTGDTNLVKVSNASKNPGKKDGLYHTTCFEVFAASPSGQYLEWNFSPSGDWCVFSFQGYRKNTVDLAGEETFSDPVFSKKEGELNFSVSMDLDLIKRIFNTSSLKIGCTTVIEFKSGKKDYYALAHPLEKPDFHDPKGFLIVR